MQCEQGMLTHPVAPFAMLHTQTEIETVDENDAVTCRQLLYLLPLLQCLDEISHYLLPDHPACPC